MTHNHEVLEGGRKKVEVVEVHGLFARMCAIALFLPVPNPFDCPTPWLNWSVLIVDCWASSRQSQPSQKQQLPKRYHVNVSVPCLQCLSKDADLGKARRHEERVWWLTTADV